LLTVDDAMPLYATIIPANTRKARWVANVVTTQRFKIAQSDIVTIFHSLSLTTFALNFSFNYSSLRVCGGKIWENFFMWVLKLQ
jgi:hypothetical protein